MFNTGVTLMVQPTPVKSLREPSADADCRKRLGLAKTLEAQAPKTGKKYVVLGIGNVGLTIVEALIMRGEKDVVGFDVAKPRRSPGKNFKLVQGDVTKYEEVDHAILKYSDHRFICSRIFLILWNRWAGLQ
ncbi:hypothetical protein T492DRAFT_523900 [Pavlovales sp. CCMP2436]|nr:hypothetical protein T492DRAFT_523900 [Pavlovales sp. CCMP2436]